LGAPALVLLSDTPGLVLGGRRIEALDRDELDAAIEHPEVTGGMRPKLLAARRALDHGAARAVIAAWNGPGTLAALLAGGGPGTTIGGRSSSAAETRTAARAAPVPAAGESIAPPAQTPCAATPSERSANPGGSTTPPAPIPSRGGFA